LSDIRPIRAFGIYAAIIIPVNFVIVILIMPAAQIIHDKYFLKYCNCYKHICPCCKKQKDANLDSLEISASKKSVKPEDKSQSENPIKRMDTHQVDNLESQDRITKCMGGCFNNFVRRFRIYILVILSVLGITAIAIAVQIGPLTEEDEMLPPDHELMILQDLMSNTFSTDST